MFFDQKAAIGTNARHADFHRPESSVTKSLQVADSLIAKTRRNGKLAALKNGLNQRFLLRVVSAKVVFRDIAG